MVRRLASVATILVLAVSVLAACGSDGSSSKTSADPWSTATISVPTIPPQPKGADGATLHIDNWAQYFDNDVVLGVKQLLEDYRASYNSGKLQGDLRKTTTKKVLRKVSKNLQAIWKADYTLPAKFEFRVESVKIDGDKATMKTCAHDINFVARRKDGSLTQKVKKNDWVVQTYILRKTDGDWRISTIPDENGPDCPPKDEK